MTANIVSINDENFSIEVKPFGEQHLATDGERVVIGVTKEDAFEGVKELQEQNTIINSGPKPVPIENYKDVGIGWFKGTSWSTSN